MKPFIDHPPVDLGRLFAELPQLASRGYNVHVASDGQGIARGITIECRDPDQHQEVHRRIAGGYFAPVIEECVACGYPVAIEPSQSGAE